MNGYTAPKSWAKLSLGELTAKTRPICYGVLKPGDFVADGVPLVRVTDISENRFDDNNLFRISDALDKEFARSRLNGGEILISIQGTVGRVALCPPEFSGANISRTIAVVDPDERVDRQYAYWFLRFLGEHDGFHTVGTTRASLNIEALRRVELPLPPLTAQRRIAAVLDRANALHAKRHTSLAHLNILPQALFFERFGDPLQNPYGFAVQPLIGIIDPLRPICYGILMPGPEQTEGVKYVRVVDLKDGGIKLSGIRKTTEAISNEFRRSLLKSGDLLMSIRGHVGRLAIVPPELDGANITQDTARLAIRGASPIFVRECLRTLGFQRWMEKHTKGVAVRGINLGDLKQMPIIVPPREAQEHFAGEVAVVEKLKAAHRASLTQMDALFASLQHRAFRGEL